MEDIQTGMSSYIISYVLTTKNTFLAAAALSFDETKVQVTLEVLPHFLLRCLKVIGTFPCAMPTSSMCASVDVGTH